MLAAMERSLRGVCRSDNEQGISLFANSCIFFRVPAIGKLLSGMPKVLYLQNLIVDCMTLQLSMLRQNWALTRYCRRI
jgi:hypothetical protein